MASQLRPLGLNNELEAYMLKKYQLYVPALCSPPLSRLLHATTTKLFFETYFVLSSLDAIFLSTGDGTHHTVIQFEPHGLTFARGLFQYLMPLFYGLMCGSLTSGIIFEENEYSKRDVLIGLMIYWGEEWVCKASYIIMMFVKNTSTLSFSSTPFAFAISWWYTTLPKKLLV